MPARSPWQEAIPSGSYGAARRLPWRRPRRGRCSPPRRRGVSKSQVTLAFPSGLSTQTFVSTAAAGTDINEVELLVGSVHTNYIAHTFKPGAWDGTTCQTAS